MTPLPPSPPRPDGRPLRIGITGGIGSGKSYVCRLLEQRLGIVVYDCDHEAKRLMRTSPDIRRQLTALIGPEAYATDGGNGHEAGGERAELTPLNKAAVARYLLASADHARAIDSIVHPAVIADFEASGQRWVESAILYESGLDRHVDHVVAVCAPDEVRIRRIMQRDAITADKARQWIARQLPQAEVCRRADTIIVNDGVQPLAPQLNALLALLAP